MTVAEVPEFQTFGSAFRGARLRHGLSQEAAAEELGVTQVTVSRWENGQSSVQRRLRAPVASFMGVTTADVAALLGAAPNARVETVIPFPGVASTPEPSTQLDDRRSIALRILALAEVASEPDPELLLRVARELRLGEPPEANFGG